MNLLKQKKVLVTGGAGFIGSHLVDALLEQEAEVRVIDDLSRGSLNNISHCRNKIEFIHGDLTKPDAAEKALKDIEICYHLAAVVGGVSFMNSHPADIFKSAIINYNMIEACRKLEVRLLYTSSACIYPVSLQTAGYQPPLAEDDALKQGAQPDSDYGWTKLLGELECQAYHKAYGMEIAIVRPFNPYGPRESFDPKDSHVIPSLIRRAANKENPFIVWGDGTQARAFEYVGDVAQGMILAAEKITDASPVNLGSTKAITIREIAELILQLTGYNITLTFDTSKPQGVKSRKADTTKAKGVLGWTPSTSIKEGLANTIEWYLGTAK